MDDRRVAEYFVVAGLPPDPSPLAEFSCDGATLKSTHSLPPVTDVKVVNRSLGEVVPDGFMCIEYTVGGTIANLNYGVLRSQEIFLCFKRGRDKPPLVDIGVLLEGRDRLLPDSQVVEFTAGNHNANINPNGVAAYITYRRATEESTCNELVVSDICIIMTNKGDKAPHSYCTVERNLNKGTMVGADIFLCYRKSVNRTNYLAYKAGILDWYPFDPRPNFPMPDNLALFCLPMGATLEAWPPQARMPDQVFSTFVLTILPSYGYTSNQETGSEGIEKVYGAAITFYERYPHDKLSPEQRQELQMNDHFGRRNLIFTNKCICILSLWPFFDTFEKFLKYLHKMVHSGNHKVPIERYIWHMLECVPFPSARRPRILIQLDSTVGISLAQPEDTPICLSGASFRKLVMCLRPEGCLLVLLYALTEQKILLHSLRPDVLTAVAEALTMIIFPFRWQCPYIPLCPLGLSDFLNAPTPFLLGLDSRFFDLYDPPTDVICIDLDTAAISIPEDKIHLTTKLLPKKPARVLKSSLDSLCGTIRTVDEQVQEHHLKPNNMLDQNIDFDFKMKRKEQELEVEIQDTFLRFNATILKGYSQYLLPIVTVKSLEENGAPSLFDVEGFVKSRERTYQKFYELLVSTQMFSKFIEERSFVSDKDASLVFFDDCIERVKDEDQTVRLLEIEPASSEHTFFLLPPEPPLKTPIDGYAYEGFPKLRRDLFPLKEPVKSLPPEFSTPQRQKRPGVAGSPGSPLARRSKHEIRSAQKMAAKYYQTPMMWAKCLLSTCFSLWFAHLPAFITIYTHKGRVLELAFHVLQRMQKQNLSHQDEVCYRVMMQLCGVYSKPVLAVKTLCEMRNAGIIPNAITYGYYNRALLESKWNPSNLLWNKLRNVMLGVSAFRQSGIERAARRKSLASSEDADSASRISEDSVTSSESQLTSQCKTDLVNSDPGYCSISESCEPVNASPSSNMEIAFGSSAGLLMTSPLDSSYLSPERKSRPRPTDLAEALSETLEKYDQIKEPSLPLPSTFDPHHTEKGPPEYLSQSNFSSRKNEIISGSLSSMKSAVTSLSKKYNIIREAFIPTPPKQSWRTDDGEEDSIDGFWGRRESFETGFHTSEEFLRRTSLSGDTDAAGGAVGDRSLPSSWSLTGPFCMGVWITSCSRCHNCQGILYDEEIMAGWRPDDSNLNTRCWHCEKLTVPFLTVTVYYLRHLQKPSHEKPTSASTKEQTATDSPAASVRRKSVLKEPESKCSVEDETIAYIQDKGIKLEPLTVPYLSPLVLRKELETMLGHDGDASLTQSSFVDHHPILYWNMLWYFSRLRLPSHLSGQCLSSLSILKDKDVHETWKEADWRHVYVLCLWDNAQYHQEFGAPLYMQWKENYCPSTLLKALTPHRAKVPKSVLESYLTLLHFNQVNRCMELLIQTLRKRPAELKYNHYPMYRDIFFFALTAVPRSELNILGFEQEFRREFEKLLPRNSKILKSGDGPPPIPAVFCRKYFWDLSL